jgi:hypothetical protein
MTPGAWRHENEKGDFYGHYIERHPMLTGTPLDLTPFGAVLEGIGTLYWMLVLAALAVALWKPKHWIVKLLSASAVIGIMVVPIALDVLAKREQQAKAKEQLDAAMARYTMRCKGAGEKIVRTVDNIEGVFLMKLRPVRKYDHESIQFKMDDPYGHDLDGEGYIETFLYKRNEKGVLDESLHSGVGYHYVEAIDPHDGKRYRYTGYHADKYHFELKKTMSTTPGSRYGVTYDDISTIDDRKMWIAGSSLRVVDLETNEVIAERIGYMIDRGQGSDAGGRQPWVFATANACPAFPPVSPTNPNAWQPEQARNFVEKVLKPISQQEK